MDSKFSNVIFLLLYTIPYNRKDVGCVGCCRSAALVHVLELYSTLFKVYKPYLYTRLL